MVGEFFNTMKTTFDFNFDFYQAVNPITVGGSGSMYSLEKKALGYRYRVEMHVHSPIVQVQLIEE